MVSHINIFSSEKYGWYLQLCTVQNHEAVVESETLETAGL